MRFSAHWEASVTPEPSTLRTHSTTDESDGLGAELYMVARVADRRATP